MGWLRDLFKDEPEIIQMHHVPLQIDYTPGEYGSLEWYNDEVDRTVRALSQEAIEEPPSKELWKVKVWDSERDVSYPIKWELLRETVELDNIYAPQRYWDVVDSGSAESESQAVYRAKKARRSILNEENAKEIELED